jgi:hypothetical protein
MRALLYDWSPERILDLVDEGERQRSRDEENRDGAPAPPASVHPAETPAQHSPSVFADMTLSALELGVEGDEARGYRVRVRNPTGAAMPPWYIVKRADRYLILGSGFGLQSLGVEALRRADAGDLDGARWLLDWAREEVVTTGDDPFAGPPLLRKLERRSEGRDRCRPRRGGQPAGAGPDGRGARDRDPGSRARGGPPTSARELGSTTRSSSDTCGSTGQPMPWPHHCGSMARSSAPNRCVRDGTWRSPRLVTTRSYAVGRRLDWPRTRTTCGPPGHCVSPRSTVVTSRSGAAVRPTARERQGPVERFQRLCLERSVPSAAAHELDRAGPSSGRALREATEPRDGPHPSRRSMPPKA